MDLLRAIGGFGMTTVESELWSWLLQRSFLEGYHS